MKFQGPFQENRRVTFASGRRAFLRLAATGLLGGVALRLDREARGVEAQQRRFVLYNHCNGLQSFHLAKSEVTSARNFKLGSFMTAFEAHKADLTVVENLFCSPGRYLHGNASSALTCAQRGALSANGPGLGELVVGGASIDQVIADHLQGNARLRSVVLGHPFRVTSGSCTQGTIVGRGKNDPVYPLLDATKAHELVFGVQNQDKVLLDLQASYLDFLKDDINAFAHQLPSQERQKLDQYLESVREVERSLSLMGGVQCPDLEKKTFPALTRNDPVFWRYMCDLAVAALQCGATNQVTLLHTYGCVHFMYTFDDVSRNHHEDVSHTDEKGAFMERILGFHAEQVAYMYQKLKAVPEAGGTMADSLLMTWMSDGGGQHHNGTRQHPMVFLGKAGGAVKTGQWHRYPKETHALACAHLTAARAMGLNLQTFGDGTDACNGPLPELLA